MRIIAGMRRGMKLLPPKGMDTRPITDRAKEALFSVLYKYGVIEQGVVADLFCGTGSMGLEALSRGAEWATFVDKDPKVVDLLERNIEKARFVAESKVIRSNAMRTGAPMPSGGPREKYDLVFVDPPYKMTYQTQKGSALWELLTLISGQVTPGAIVVVRTNRRAMLDERYGELEVVDRRQWGTMAVTLLQLPGGEATEPAREPGAGDELEYLDDIEMLRERQRREEMGEGPDEPGQDDAWEDTDGGPWE